MVGKEKPEKNQGAANILRQQRCQLAERFPDFGCQLIIIIRETILLLHPHYWKYKYTIVHILQDCGPKGQDIHRQIASSGFVSLYDDLP